MLNPDLIPALREAIEKEFIDQLTSGKQSTFFTTQKALACGQFLRSPELSQRGLHGTIAALFVLAQAKEEVTRLHVPKLVRYLEQRETLEATITSHDAKLPDRLDRDSRNVIKLGEALYALSFVKSGLAKTEAFQKKIAKKLSDSMVQSTGWPYYTNYTSDSPALLPTAYATLGLSATGFEVTRPLEFLVKELNAMKGTKLDDTSHFAEACLCLYVVSTNRSKLDQATRSSLKHITRRLMKAPLCSFSDYQEQNIEYRLNAEHDYVRVPWQLYLIAAASINTPWRNMTWAIQKHLDGLRAEIQGAGFKYRWSGPRVSARTSAILYECLKHLQQSSVGSFWRVVLLSIDWVRRLFGSKLFRIFAQIGIGLFLLYSVLHWYSEPSASLSDLAPDIIVPLLFEFYIIGKSPRR